MKYAIWGTFVIPPVYPTTALEFVIAHDTDAVLQWWIRRHGYEEYNCRYDVTLTTKNFIGASCKEYSVCLPHACEDYDLVVQLHVEQLVETNESNIASTCRQAELWDKIMEDMYQPRPTTLMFYMALTETDEPDK